MASSVTATTPTREEVVPSRKRVKLPPWLEVAKPRLIPLLLATTLGGMALTEGWPLSSPRLVLHQGWGRHGCNPPRLANMQMGVI